MGWLMPCFFGGIQTHAKLKYFAITLLIGAFVACFGIATAFADEPAI